MKSPFLARLQRLYAWSQSPEAAPARAKALAEGQGYGEPDVVEQEDGTVAIRLYGEILDHFTVEMFGLPGAMAVSDTGFARSLDRARAMGKPMLLRVNCIGGDVFSGTAISNMVREAKLDAIVDGNAASIASVIICGSPHVTMLPGTTLMVHNPQTGLWGNAQDMRANATVLDQIAEAMLDIYTAKTGAKFSRDDWRAALAGKDGGDGSWMSAGEALTAGIADEAVRANQEAPTAALIEQRRITAALYGVKLPESLAELPGTVEPQKPEPPALGGAKDEKTKAGTALGHRKGAFSYLPRQ